VAAAVSQLSVFLVATSRPLLPLAPLYPQSQTLNLHWAVQVWLQAGACSISPGSDAAVGGDDGRIVWYDGWRNATDPDAVSRCEASGGEVSCSNIGEFSISFCDA
jgi:hypothetical protein